MKKTLIMILVTIVVIVVGSLLLVDKYDNKEVVKSSSNIKNNPYFIRTGSIDGEDLIYKDLLVSDYKKYQEIMLYYQMEEELKEDDFKQYDYLAIVVENDHCNGNIKSISHAEVEDNNVEIIVDLESTCDLCAPKHDLYFVRFNKNVIGNNFKVNVTYDIVNQISC